MYASKRLTEVYDSAEELLWDNTSRLVFFSDCHRGDGSRYDDFTKNKSLYLSALMHYYDNGFTYIEIGDGDELWKFTDYHHIYQAHQDVFELLRKYHAQKRLYMIWGNHDMVKKSRRYAARKMCACCKSRSRNYQPLFDNIKIHEGLILRQKATDGRIFVTHGHQGDFLNDRLWFISRFLVHHIGKYVEIVGIQNPASPAYNAKRKNIIEKNIIQWVQANHCPVIAGHTHRAMFPGADEPPYFNTGCCVHHGSITCIEVQDGKIALVSWSLRTIGGNNTVIDKQVLAGPKKIDDF